MLYRRPLDSRFGTIWIWSAKSLRRDNIRDSNVSMGKLGEQTPCFCLQISSDCNGNMKQGIDGPKAEESDWVGRGRWGGSHLGCHAASGYQHHHCLR